MDAIKYRESFRTARFRVREVEIRPGWATTVRNNEYRLAGDKVMMTEFGDDDGMWSYRDLRAGEAPLGVSGMYAPKDYVIDKSAGLVWGRRWNSPFIGVGGDEFLRSYVDIRTVGLRSEKNEGRDPRALLDLLSEIDGLNQAKITRDQGVTTITVEAEVRSDKNRYEYQWEIDENRGPSVVAARTNFIDQAGRRILISEVHNTLAQTDGVWWPIKTEYVFPQDNGRLTIDFSVVEFNRPQHPNRLNADSLGVPPGGTVYRYGKRGREHYIGGGATVDDQTWQTMISKFDLEPYKAFSKQVLSMGSCAYPSWWNSNDGSEGLQGVADQPDQWEAYVRRWVMRRTSHSAWRVKEPLTDAQCTTAKSILDECRSKAVPIRTRLDKEASAVSASLSAVETALTALQSTEVNAPTIEASVPEAGESAFHSGVGKQKAASEHELNDKIKALQQRKEEFAKSPEIERLFDELKARLDGMLTTQQRDPANGSFQRPAPPPLPQSPHSARPMLRSPARPTSQTSSGK